MTRLNATAKAALKNYGVSQAEWARRNYYSGGRWGGDACGCPDDRCTGYHHDGPDDCGCLPALLARAERGPRRPHPARADGRPVLGTGHGNGGRRGKDHGHARTPHPAAR